MHRFSFNYPCVVAVLTPEGDMVSWSFGCGETIEYVPHVITLQACQTMSFETPEGYTLIDIPLSAIHFEPGWHAHSV